MLATQVKATDSTTANLLLGGTVNRPGPTYLGGFTTTPTFGGSTPTTFGGSGSFPTYSPYQQTVIEGLGDTAATACDKLPVILKEACKAASGAIFGNGGNGTTQYQPGGTVSPCPSGTIRVGSTCVAPGDVFPGGDPFTFPAGGGAVQGAFGLPAIQPAQQQRTRLRCPTGMVLGRDNLCYPKQVLPRRSKWRKWRPAPRPKISAAEWKTLRRAKRVKEEAREVAKEAGYKVTNR